MLGATVSPPSALLVDSEVASWLGTSRRSRQTARGRLHRNWLLVRFRCRGGRVTRLSVPHTGAAPDFGHLDGSMGSSGAGLLKLPVDNDAPALTVRKTAPVIYRSATDTSTPSPSTPRPPSGPRGRSRSPTPQADWSTAPRSTGSPTRSPTTTRCRPGRVARARRSSLTVSTR